MHLDKTTFNRVVHFLRRNFTWSPVYRNVKKRCHVAFGVYRCEGCERFICLTQQDYDRFERTCSNDIQSHMVSIEKFAVDHIEPVGTLSGSLDEAASKIFCDESNLQGLCMTCHFFKTRIDMENIKQKKKSLLDKIELGEL